MKCKDILQQIEQDFPKHKAYAWDNVGLLVGRDDKEISKIFVALDVTENSIEEAIEWGADLLITHHPMIFEPLKQINNHNFISNRVIKLLQADISYYAMHTNYDIVKMADLASDRLELVETKPLEVSEWDVLEGLGKVGLPKESCMTLEAYAQHVKKVFGLEEVKVFGEKNTSINKVAVLPGSGKSCIDASIAEDVDVLVTGDIGHHDGIDANARGMAIIDAGHYGIEHIFIEDMCCYLSKFIDDTQKMKLEIKGAAIDHPFLMI